MEELNLDITVDGKPIGEIDTLNFHNILENYDNSVLPSIDNPASIHVNFNELVILTALDVSSGGGNIPDEIGVIITRVNGSYLTDENGNDLSSVIHLYNEKLDLSFLRMLVDEMLITVVSSSEPSFTLPVDLIGCVHPGKKKIPVNLKVYSI